jgi:hypothetical protein
VVSLTKVDGGDDQSERYARAQCLVTGPDDLPMVHQAPGEDRHLDGEARGVCREACPVATLARRTGILPAASRGLGSFRPWRGVIEGDHLGAQDEVSALLLLPVSPLRDRSGRC